MYEAHEAHLAHPAHNAHSAMSMLDCPNDFHRENSSFSAFEKNRLHRDGPSDRRTDATSYRDARTHLKIAVAIENSFFVVFRLVVVHIVNFIQIGQKT